MHRVSRLPRLHQLLAGPVADRLRRPAWVVLVELFIGLGWARAVVEKLIDPDWWSGAAIADFVADHEADAVAWYTGIATEVWVPFADVVGVTVLALQVIAAVTLVTGRRVELGLGAGMFLNLHFVLAGAVDPSIFYLVAQSAVAMHLLERDRSAAGRRVLDWLNVGAVILVGASAPMIRTLHPAEVVDDPAVVLATFGGLMFLATSLVLVRRTARVTTAGRPADTAGLRRPATPGSGRAEVSELRRG
ncbi:MAG: hypothetical protein AAGG08_09495 [Actinomycetota bacterium]